MPRGSSWFAYRWLAARALTINPFGRLLLDGDDYTRHHSQGSAVRWIKEPARAGSLYAGTPQGGMQCGLNGLWFRWLLRSSCW